MGWRLWGMHVSTVKDEPVPWSIQITSNNRSANWVALKVQEVEIFWHFFFTLQPVFSMNQCRSDKRVQVFR